MDVVRKSKCEFASIICDNFESRLIKFCKRKLEMLIGYGITPILIFDGAKLLMKHQTELDRQRNREEHRKKGEEYLR